MELEAPEKQVPHVLVFPFPAQGHINSMLKLSQLLCLAGFRVTFLNTDYNHDRLQRFSDVGVITSRWPKFRFRTISDGLSAGDSRSAENRLEIVYSMQVHSKLLFRDMLISRCRESDMVTCIIADGVMSFTIDVADELGIPIITFRTISACSFWAYFCVPRLIKEGELPFKEGDDMDRMIRNVAGMENFLRRRDLPSFLRAKELDNPEFQFVLKETLSTTRTAGLILNTFEELEGPILSEIRSPCSNIYTIGPLHALLKSKIADSDSFPSSSSNSSLWKEDKTCITWLDSQLPKSVLYVSFGSFATVSHVELLEIWHGLVNSLKPFLWAIRPDSVTGKGEANQIPVELEKGTRERGFLVEWAPQQEVLGHPAVGGFLTHSGWNSTLESIFTGVPMICWPFFADQQINSRFVSEVWKIGLDMKDRCDRETVEKMVRELMEGKEGELQKSAHKMAESAKQCVSEGGSSYCNLERLFKDIKSMRL